MEESSLESARVEPCRVEMGVDHYGNHSATFLGRAGLLTPFPFGQGLCPGRKHHQSGSARSPPGETGGPQMTLGLCSWRSHAALVPKTSRTQWAWCRQTCPVPGVWKASRGRV